MTGQLITAVEALRLAVGRAGRVFTSQAEGQGEDFPPVRPGVGTTSARPVESKPIHDPGNHFGISPRIRRRSGRSPSPRARAEVPRAAGTGDRRQPRPGGGG